MLVPGSPPPPASSFAGSDSAGALRGQAAGHRQRRVERLEPGGQRIGKGDVVAPGGGDHHDLRPHLRSQPDSPGAVLVAFDVGGIIYSLVGTLHGEAMVGGLEVQVRGRVAQPQAVVEPPLAFLADDEVFLLAQLLHRDGDMMVVGIAPLEIVLTGEVISKPGARHKVGLLGLEDLEVAVEAQEHEGVFLRIPPAALRAVREQPLHHLGDEVALGGGVDHRLEDDCIGAPGAVQQQVGAVGVGGRELSRGGGLGDQLPEALEDGGALLPGIRIAGDDVEQPGGGLQRRLLRRRVGQQFASLSESLLVGHLLSGEELADVETVGLDGRTAFLGIAGGQVLADVLQVALGSSEHILGNSEVLLPGAGERVGDVDAEVGGGAVLSAPPAEASIGVLKALELLQVPSDRGDHVLGVRQALGLEGRQDIAQGGRGQDAGGDLRGAAVGVLREVEIRSGQGMQGR